VAYLAMYGDLVWVLDAEQREILLRLTPSAFDNGAAWGICLAQADALNGDAPSLRLHAEAARKGNEELLLATPDDPQLHAFLGLALAYLGEKQAAMREGERAVQLFPESGYVRHLLARIDTVFGETGRAIDQLELALKDPGYYVTPAWLGIDPTLDPLRQNPRFQKLVAGGK
jgi:tetratricopeptide (TPR) repeat protein